MSGWGVGQQGQEEVRGEAGRAKRVSVSKNTCGPRAQTHTHTQTQTL